MVSKRFASLTKKIIAKHGAVIDLQRNPEVLREIFRELGSTIGDDPYPPDNPCGGTPPQPGPPGPSGGLRPGPTGDDIYRAVQKLSREVRAMQKAVVGAAVVPRTRAPRKSSK